MKCAYNYQKLMAYEYRFTLGRKGKLTEIVLRFSNTDFHHLAGLHKLKDTGIARANRDAVFQQILDGRITYDTIIKSQFLPEFFPNGKNRLYKGTDAVHTHEKRKMRFENRANFYTV